MTFVFILSAVTIAIMFYWLGVKSGYSDGVDVGYRYGRTDGRNSLCAEVGKIENERMIESGSNDAN